MTPTLPGRSVGEVTISSLHSKNNNTGLKADCIDGAPPRTNAETAPTFLRKTPRCRVREEEGFKAGPSGEDLLNIYLIQSLLVRTGAFPPPCLQNAGRQRLFTSTQEGDFGNKVYPAGNSWFNLATITQTTLLKTETKLHFTDVVKSKAVSLKKF